MSTQTASPPADASPPTSRRPWYYLGAFVALLVATPIAYYLVSAWLSERELRNLEADIDASDPGWRWHDIVASVTLPPDEKNSAVQIVKVRTLLKRKALAPGGPWAAGGKDPFEKPNVRLSDEWSAPLLAAFEDFPEETIREARKLKDMPFGRYGVENNETPFLIRLDHVQDVRIVLALLQHDVARRAFERDFDGAAESCLALVNTSHSLKDQPFLIAFLVRIAGEAITRYSVEHTLAQGVVSEAMLTKLQESLERAAAEDGLHYAMRGERASGHQMYFNLRDGKMTLSQMSGMTGIKLGIPERLLDMFPGLILSGYPEYLRFMNDQVHASTLKDADRLRAFQKLDEKSRQSRAYLTRLILPATAKVGQASARGQAKLRCAIVAIAAERYRLQHKAWPKRIEDLVDAKLLSTVPIDPYDGKPLRMKRTPTGMIIYSVGFDETDNGGSIDRSNPMAPGADLGFELWDPKHRAIAP